MTELGPVSHLGSGIVKQTIVSSLKENQNYSLQVRAETHTVQTVTSNKHFFSESNYACVCRTLVCIYHRL